MSNLKTVQTIVKLMKWIYMLMMSFTRGIFIKYVKHLYPKCVIFIAKTQLHSDILPLLRHTNALPNYSIIEICPKN